MFHQTQISDTQYPNVVQMVVDSYSQRLKWGFLQFLQFTHHFEMVNLNTEPDKIH